MPQATAPTPRPQKPTRSNSVRMDFAPRKGGVPQRPVAKSVAKPAAPSRPASVTKPAAKPAPKAVAKPVSRPAPHPAPKSTPQPTTPERRPALIASAREAMNAHIYAQQAQQAQQPQSSPSSPEQGTTAPTAPQATAPQAATRLHRTTVQTATRQRVTPMPTLPPPPTRPVAPLRAGTDPLVQRARPLPKSTPAPSAPKQQIKVSASAASTASTAPTASTPSDAKSHTRASTPNDTKSSLRTKLPPLAAFSRAASTNPNSDSAATTEDTSANNTRYALGERSPFFLQSVSVEKRPLSSGRPASRSTARKNIYPKKPAAPKPEKPSLPTIVVPDSHRSKAPLIALILFTILLGALVGAAAYFFFFQ